MAVVGLNYVVEFREFDSGDNYTVLHQVQDVSIQTSVSLLEHYPNNSGDNVKHQVAALKNGSCTLKTLVEDQGYDAVRTLLGGFAAGTKYHFKVKIEDTETLMFSFGGVIESAPLTTNPDQLNMIDFSIKFSDTLQIAA